MDQLIFPFNEVDQDILNMRDDTYRPRQHKRITRWSSQSEQLGFEEIQSAPSSIAPITYVGSKKNLYQRIAMGILPDLPKKMVSPFMGGASLELKFAASGVKVYAYDIFEPIVEFYQVFNERSAEVREKTLDIYPLEKEVYLHMARGGGWEQVECLIHRAAITWSITKQSYMGRNFSSVPVAPIHAITREYFNDPQWITWHNPYIEFGVADFRDALAKHPDAFAYLDPPYIDKEKFYGRFNEQGGFPHEELRDILNDRENWVLSYGDHPRIHELYADYNILYPKWSYGFGKALGAPEKSAEVLIISHDLANAKKNT